MLHSAGRHGNGHAFRKRLVSQKCSFTILISIQNILPIHAISVTALLMVRMWLMCSRIRRRIFLRQGEICPDIVRNAGNDSSACSEVRDIVLNNGGMEYASEVLDTYIEQAVTATEAYGASPFRDALREMARYNACRQV